MVCQDATNAQPSLLAPIVWFSTWSLLSTCFTWTAWVRYHFFGREDDSISTETMMSLLEVSLPLSVTVSFAYTVYLASNHWGTDIVDTDVCYGVVGTGIPIEGTSPAGVAIFFGFALLSNLCMHYLCAVVNLVLYFNCNTRRPWQPWLTLGLLASQSITIVLLQDFGGFLIYCTDNIFLACTMTLFVCMVVHALCFLRRLSVPTGVADFQDDAHDNGQAEINSQDRAKDLEEPWATL